MSLRSFDIHQSLDELTAAGCADTEEYWSLVEQLEGDCDISDRSTLLDSLAQAGYVAIVLGLLAFICFLNFTKRLSDR